MARSLFTTLSFKISSNVASTQRTWLLVTTKKSKNTVRIRFCCGTSCFSEGGKKLSKFVYRNIDIFIEKICQLIFALGNDICQHSRLYRKKYRFHTAINFTITYHDDDFRPVS